MHCTRRMQDLYIPRVILQGLILYKIGKHTHETYTCCKQQGTFPGKILETCITTNSKNKATCNVHGNTFPFKLIHFYTTLQEGQCHPQCTRNVPTWVTSSVDAYDVLFLRYKPTHGCAFLLQPYTVRTIFTGKVPRNKYTYILRLRIRSVNNISNAVNPVIYKKKWCIKHYTYTRDMYSNVYIYGGCITSVQGCRYTVSY